MDCATIGLEIGAAASDPHWELAVLPNCHLVVLLTPVLFGFAELGFEEPSSYTKSCNLPPAREGRGGVV